MTTRAISLFFAVASAAAYAGPEGLTHDESAAYSAEGNAVSVTAATVALVDSAARPSVPSAPSTPPRVDSGSGLEVL